MAFTKSKTMEPCGHKQRDAQLNREQWIHFYAERILKIWKDRQTRLGVANEYIQHIIQDLGQHYENPLQRMFIESTY